MAARPFQKTIQNSFINSWKLAFHAISSALFISFGEQNVLPSLMNLKQIFT